MAATYLCIRENLDSALKVLAEWSGLSPLDPPSSQPSSSALISSALNPQGQWRGAAFAVHEVDGWAVLSDLTGRLSGISVDGWRALAGRVDFDFLTYDESARYSEFVRARAGTIARAFSAVSGEPDFLVSHGEDPPLESWIDVAQLVEEHSVITRAQGTGKLWILAGSPP